MDKTSSAVAGPQAPAVQRPRRPNYNALHAQPLPLKTFPLPPLIPHNPLSVFYIAFTYLRQLVNAPSSHADAPFHGVFSPETRSVHVTDPAAVRALWEHGFFGKGSLSRSEPTWLDREKRRLGLLVGETSEEITRRRREERKAFKQERARKQREELEQKKKAETSQPDVMVFEANSELEKASLEPQADRAEVMSESQVPLLATDPQPVKTAEAGSIDNPESNPPQANEVEIVNHEHLQLDLNEAFFLSYGLGVLSIFSPHSHTPLSQAELLQTFMAHATFPPLALPLGPSNLQPDNKFLLHYVAYHHFRSLGWVVRPGIKFGVDLLLYNRGPVFTHAEFAIVVVPSFSHNYWKQGAGKAHLERARAGKAWHWLHMVSRVQSQVKKTLVLCFVEVPPSWAEKALVPGGGIGDIGKVLRRYKVREFVLRRWVPNRTRD